MVLKLYSMRVFVFQGCLFSARIKQLNYQNKHSIMTLAQLVVLHAVNIYLMYLVIYMKNPYDFKALFKEDGE